LPLSTTRWPRRPAISPCGTDGDLNGTALQAVPLVAALGSVIALTLSGCVLSPQGAVDEQGRLVAASQSFEASITARQIPDLPAEAQWRDVLSRAFLTNGELESAYFEWKAAFARIDQAATLPNSNVAVTFSYMFSSENVKAWDRSPYGPNKPTDCGNSSL
jgi:cobalt-zinc-cadmium efflux system outer membrane protein